MKNKNLSFKLLFRYLGFVYKLRPTLFASFLALGILESFSVFILITIPKLMIDALTEKVGFQLIFIRLLPFFLLYFVLHYLSSLFAFIIQGEIGLFDTLVSIRLSEKVNVMKYENLESPDILELKEKARMPIQMGVVSEIAIYVKEIIVAVFTLSGVGVLLFSFNSYFLLFVTVLAILKVLVDVLFAAKSIAFMQEIVPLNRKYNYFFGILTSDKKQKEFRTYSSNLMILEKAEEFNTQIAEKLKKVHISQANGMSFGFLFEVIAKGSMYGFVGLRTIGVLGEKILFGNLSLLIGANEAYFRSLTGLVGSFLHALVSIQNIAPIFDFLDLPEREDSKDAKDAHEFHSLVFENVSFSYPNTEKKILDKLSFHVKKGETIALVGVNHSGKSTIVKLICRLFEPTEGRILWNGVDIRKLKYEDYLRRLSTVFQDFKLFPISIAENVLAEVKEEGEEFSEEKKRKLSEVIKKVELNEVIAKLPHGLDSKFNKNLYEDGVELSGGEKQKLAIARAICGSASFAILDEPTAALDPLAEAEVYEHFSELVKDKTAIFISHRMSASRFADRILVLEGGRVTGDGTHAELVRENELYKRLYEAQAQYYR